MEVTGTDGAVSAHEIGSRERWARRPFRRAVSTPQVLDGIGGSICRKSERPLSEIFQDKQTFHRERRPHLMAPLAPISTIR
jgi:hypothetical protein